VETSAPYAANDMADRPPQCRPHEDIYARVRGGVPPASTAPRFDGYADALSCARRLQV